ncbi:hypothetical protein LJC45_01180 [Alistipes sp. OttesenSCG-928-B03]|nr:hypothetical protein [Alistipes sp. OttesenSCG-928-B03]
MNDWKSLRDKGNAWKLIYTAFVAVENAPEDFIACCEDEDGNYYEDILHHTPDEIDYIVKNVAREEITYHQICLSQALSTFLSECENGKATFPFTFEAYLKNKDIIDTIKAYELDVEQFWYATLFIYWLTQIRCVNVDKRAGSIGEQMRKLSDYLQDTDSFAITTEGKKKLVINDVGVIREIREFLNKQLIENPLAISEAYSINLNSSGGHLESASVQMWFAATRYQKLFESLGLPTMRAVDSEVKYKDEEGYRVAVSGGNKIVSYNKMLLISRLMYFMRFTRNDKFLASDDSLGGIIRQYKDLNLNSHNPKYLF